MNNGRGKQVKIHKRDNVHRITCWTTCATRATCAGSSSLRLFALHARQMWLHICQFERDDLNLILNHSSDQFRFEWQRLMKILTLNELLCEREFIFSCRFLYLLLSSSSGWQAQGREWKWKWKENFSLKIVLISLAKERSSTRNYRTTRFINQTIIAFNFHFHLSFSSLFFLLLKPPDEERRRLTFATCLSGQCHLKQKIASRSLAVAVPRGIIVWFLPLRRGPFAAASSVACASGC